MREDWRAEIMARVHANQRQIGSLRLTAGEAFAGYVVTAAKGRDMALVAYLRRAVAISAAADLDLPVTELLAHCPAPLPWGKRGGGGRLRGLGLATSDDGSGIWCPHPGCSGDHAPTPTSEGT